LSILKPKDYEPGTEVDAPTHYAAWASLKDSAEPLLPGDVLESQAGELRIFKYVGFEEAQWHVPETKATVDASGVAPPGQAAGAS
jgi:hypothetical protein